ncbi:MAG: 23S rRNA (pseudouridine(1915)-N(3))-methyltransferase RlmH [Acidobacteriota bacterium]
MPYPRLVLITLAHVGSSGKDGFDSLVEMYLERSAGYARCRAQAFRGQAALLEWLTRQSGRTQPVAVLLDSRGRAMDSEKFAAWIGARRDEGAQHLVFAIGPADGWSEEARKRARLLLSLGPMTLAHALARLVLAEQIYRALTILAGHPYHCGH